MFLIISNIILYYVPFSKYLWKFKVLLASIALESIEKDFTLLFNPVVFVLLILNSFEILRKHNA